MKVKYSPDASDKLKQIRKYSGKKTTSDITRSIRGLIENPYKCPTIENILGIPSDYYFLHVGHHYIFYRVNDDSILISNIYNEKENFMWKMFGIKLRTQESMDYWGE